MEISLFYFRGMMGNIWVDVHGVHLCDTLQENQIIISLALAVEAVIHLFQFVCFFLYFKCNELAFKCILAAARITLLPISISHKMFLRVDILIMG